MNKLLRLTLILFMWFNAISYADTTDLKLEDATDLKLEQVREYSYYNNGKLSIERIYYIYDKDTISRKTRYYYYDKYGIASVEERNENGENELFAYEYKNGNLVKIYKVWNYSNRTTKYKAVGDFKIEYEYNRYGNLVYSYRYSFTGLSKTRYEYNSSGKLTLANVSEGGSRFEEVKCRYDSDGKLIEEVFTADFGFGDLGFPVNIKYEYDGNLLYSANITVDRWLAVKAKYEYNSAGQLIRIYQFGSAVYNGNCRPLHSEIAFAYRQRESFYYDRGF